MLGNAPTRVVVCAQLESDDPRIKIRSGPLRKRLFTSLPPTPHGQHASLLFVFVSVLVFPSGPAPAFCGPWTTVRDEVSQSRIFQNIRRGIANVQKDLIQSAMRQIAVDEHA